MTRITELEEAQYVDEIFHRPAPLNVWHYENYASWKDVFWRLISDVVDEEVKASFVSNPPEDDDFTIDDFSWLTTLLSQCNRPRTCVLTLLEERVRSHYQLIRCYHATRTDDIASYYRHGLLPLDPSATHERVRRILLTGQYPEITESIFANAVAHPDLIRYLEAKNLAGEIGISFVLNKYISIREGYNHYLKYGSEYAQALVCRLSPDRSQSNNYIRDYSSHTIPILFVCDVPLNIVRSSLVSTLIRSGLYSIFKGLIENMDSYIPDGGIVTDTGVPADSIVGHAVIHI